MTERKDEPNEEGAAQDERKPTLSEGLEQIFFSARNAVVPGARIDLQMQDLNAAFRALVVINDSLPDTPVEEIRRRLLSVQLTNNIRLQIARACPELSIDIGDIQAHHQEVGFKSAASIDENGFLEGMLRSKAGAVDLLLTEDTCNELNRLESEVAKIFQDEAAPGLVHLLFYCLDGDLERVQAIIQAQVRSYHNIEQLLAHEAVGHHETVPPPPAFFRQLINFLKEYSYISQFLLDNSEYPNGMEGRCRSALTTVLRHPSLTSVRRMKHDPEVQLDQILLEFSTPNGGSKPDEFTNPWFQGDLKQTPFDALKVRNILRMGMSYQEKARILLTINKYALEGEETTTLGDTDRPEKRKDAHQKLSPEALLLGKAFLALLHPKCIVRNRAVQLEFMDIVKSLEGDDRLRNDPELARSISTLLHTNDPYLDIPIRGCRNQSIRELLMHLCFEYFDDDAIRNGVSVKGETIRLFPLCDAERLIVSPEVPLQRHFNNAFIGLERGFLSDAGEAMASIYSFDEIVKMAEKEAVRFLNAKEGGQLHYRFYFYHSAGVAFRDVIRRFFFSEFDYQECEYNAVISNQEFNGFTEVLEQNGEPNPWRRKDFQDPGLRPVTLNNQDTGQPKTVEELYDDIVEQVDPERTQLILLSSQTRFGDAPCAVGEKPASYYLAQLIKALKQTFPNIPVAIDACQAVGRTRTDSLTRLGADIYFISGGKALGVGNADMGARIGVVALSQEFLKRFPKIDRKDFYSNYSTTMPRANIAAMMLAMHALSSNVDLSRIEGNLKEQRRHSLEQKIAARMSELTDYVIQKADEYGERFVADYLPVIAPELLAQHSRDQLVSWMGCRVHYPAHRSKRDYSGIVTLDLPTKSAKYILPVLQAKPHKFDVSTCLYKDRALRISLNYLHEKADIDALFNALMDVHAELLKEDLRQGKRFRDRRSWTTR